MEISVNSPLFLSHFFRSRPGAEGGITVPGRRRSGSGLRGPAGPPSVACALFSLICICCRFRKYYKNFLNNLCSKNEKIFIYLVLFFKNIVIEYKSC